MKEIAQEFDIHYATVSRIVKIKSNKSINARPDPNFPQLPLGARVEALNGYR